MLFAPSYLMSERADIVSIPLLKAVTALARASIIAQFTVRIIVAIPVIVVQAGLNLKAVQATVIIAIAIDRILRIISKSNQPYIMSSSYLMRVGSNEISLIAGVWVCR